MRSLRIVTSVCLALVLLLIGVQVVSQAQSAQPVFRIGVLDNERGSIANGARLAVREINDRGGLTDAQGTTFRLEMVIEPASPRSQLEESVLNLANAGVDAVLGPETNQAVASALPFLRTLGVPILTPATDDLVIVSDSSQSLFRVRAAERLQGGALADYLVVQSGVRQIISVQLDQSSFSEHIGFISALARQPESLQRSVVRYDEDEGILAVADEIIERDPQAVVAFGPPLLVSRFYTELRQAGWVGLFAYNRATMPAFYLNIPFDELHGILSATTWSPDTPTSRSRAFLERYVDAYDDVPGPVEAASYDALYLLAEAISRPGDLQSALSSVRDLPGAQGTLNATGLPRGELSDTVAIIQLNALGGTDLRLRYAAGEPIDPAEEIIEIPTPTPQPTATPDGVFLRIMSAVQNVRTGPGLSYPVLGQMSQGETARLIGTSIDYSWVVISFRGQQGWLATYLLEVTGDLRTLPIIPAPPAPTVPATPIPVPIYIGFQTPTSGNIVAGSLLIFGSALHPQFLQYQLEYAPIPNPPAAWTPIAFSHTPVLNGLLGVWNTIAVPDGFYQIRLNVILRDGTALSTMVTNIRVQNNVSTPVPTATPVVPPPFASFMPDQTSGEAPLAVRFTNQSTGSITSYRWNFGDGASSSEANPSHTFTTPGIYTVSLEATGPGGVSNFSWQINVRTASAPVAGFSLNTASGPAPLTVQFTDQSSGSVTSRLWNFSDGTTSTETNPSHTFTGVGTYNVFLTVTGPGGSSIARRQVVVQNPVSPPPNALFSLSPTTGVAPLAVQFTNQSSGNITGYTWNFGDGSISNEPNPSHTFASSGNYTVTLYASGPGGISTAQANVIVSVPTATASPVPPVVTLAPPQITDTLTNTAIPPDNTLTPSETPTATFTPTETPVPPTATFTLTETPVPPTATFTLTETPVPPTATFTLTETPVPPTATFTLTETPVPPTETPVPPTDTPTPEPVVAAFSAAQIEGVPLTVQFTSAASGPVISYAWDFGDGTTSNEIHPLHTFPGGGDFPVTLTVTSTDGVTTNSVTNIVTVTAPAPTETPVLPTMPPEPVDAAFAAAPVEGVPLTIQFTDQSVGPVADYLWDFGDGAFGSEQHPAHAYGQAGDYTVTLIVTAADGVTIDSTAQTVTVAAAPEPTPEPTLEPTLEPSPEPPIDEPTPEVPAPQPLLTLIAGLGEVNDAKWSPDDTRIAAANQDGTISLWDVNSGQVVNMLIGHAAEATTLDWSPDGLLLVSGSADGQILIWDIASLQPVATQQAADAITDVAWTAAGTSVAAASADGSVMLLDTAGNVTPLTLASAAVNALAWGVNDASLLIAANDGSIILHDIASGQPVYTLNANMPVTALDWSPDFLRFVTGLDDGTAVIWDAASGLGVLPPFDLSDGAITAAAWSLDGTQILSGDANGAVALWSAADGTVIQTFVNHTAAITAVEWNAVGTQFLSASDDGAVLIWQP